MKTEAERGLKIRKGRGRVETGIPPAVFLALLCGLLDFSHLAPVGAGWSPGGWAHRARFLWSFCSEREAPVSGLFQGLCLRAKGRWVKQPYQA